MSKLILHYGMHKTGSSSIQESLFRRLSDPRFHYINLGVANASGKIATGFIKDLATFHAHKRRGTPIEDLRRMKRDARESLSREFALCAGKAGILSGEVISTLDEAEFRDLFAFVPKEITQVQAVGYVRPPKAYMESAFQQMVKDGALNQLTPSGLLPRYRERFEKLELVMGRDAVQYWLFSPKTFVGGCVVQDFCARLGISFPAKEAVRVNEALSIPALSLLFAYRKFGFGQEVGPTAIQENNLLVERIAVIPGPKLRLHSSLVAPAIEKHRDDIAWMEGRLGCALQEDLTADDDDAIQSEEELLNVSPETLRWLATQLGPEYERRCYRHIEAEEVAGWVDALRKKLAGEDQTIKAKLARHKRANKRVHNEQGAKRMGVIDLVRVKQEVPGLDELSNGDAAALLAAVFKQIREQIEGTEQGLVRIPGFGDFRVRQLEGGAVKRIVFTAAQDRLA